MTREHYDAVVIGSGPNGLAAAITLAQANRSVALFEAASTVGGGMRSAELTLPGFVHDVCSAIHPLARASPFFATPDLGRHGLEWIEPPVSLAHPLDDGSAALVTRDVAATAVSLGRDGPAYRRFIGPTLASWDALIEDVLAPFHIPFQPDRAFGLARFGLGALQPASWLVRSFADPPARALLAGCAAHSMLRLEEPISGAFKLDLALDGPVPWRSPELAGAGTVHLGGTFEEIAASEREVARGRNPERPFVLLAQHSLFDGSRAPDGKHTVWAYCHVPNGSPVDMSDRIIDQIERFAPGLRDRILGRHAMGPAQLESYNANYVGGDINGGRQDLGQLFTRPTLRLDPYSTPDPAIFICSSSTPPGGGVHGMCGHLAAKSVLKAGER